jgi:vancomycin resistance protein YoaR
MGKAQKKSEAQEQAQEQVLSSSYSLVLKNQATEFFDRFWGDIDPQKLLNFKNEALKVLKKGSFTTIGIVSVVAILLVGELWFNGKVYANTKVGNVSVGLQSFEQSRNLIQEEVQKFLKSPITFEYQGQKAEITPEEMGVSYNVDQAFATLPRYRFSESNPLIIALSAAIPRKVELQFTYDRNKALRTLEQKFGLVELRAKNATIVLQDKDFIVQPEKAGKSMNEDRILESLRTNFSHLEANAITVTTVDEKPRITAAKLTEQKDALVEKIKKPLTLRAGDKTYKLTLSDHLNAVELSEKPYLKVKGTSIKLPIQLDQKEVTINENSPVELTSNLEVKINGGVLDPVLHEDFIKKIEVPTSPVSISKNDDGTIKIEGKGEDGKTVPRNRLMAAIAIATNNGLTEVPVPVVVEKAPITISDDLKELGIRELIATGHSSYYGSPTNRMFNIAHGIQRFNGVIVQPGEEFSFNTQLGDVDGAHGYKLEHVIKKNKVELEMGGGICQVSTTAYRAALLAGLPITERREHTWKIAYYGQTMGTGLDATIYIGGQDMKFVNDTPAAILIQSYVEDSNAYFKFYGTSDGRKVAMEGPIGGGLHWKWYRTITKDGKETKEAITSDYHPIPAPDPPKPKVVAQAPGSTL